jgi:hypothetical protein
VGDEEEAVVREVCSASHHVTALTPAMDPSVGIHGLILSDWATQYDGYLWVPRFGNWTFMIQRPDVRFLPPPQVRNFGEINLQKHAEVYLWLDGGLVVEMNDPHPAGFSNEDENHGLEYYWSSSVNTTELDQGYHRVQLQMHVQSSIRGLRVGMCLQGEHDSEKNTSSLLRLPIRVGGEENATCMTRQSFMGITEHYLRGVVDGDLKDTVSSPAQEERVVLERTGICVDVDECLLDESPCKGVHTVGEWQCVNIEGSFECQPNSWTASIANSAHVLFYTPLGMALFIVSCMALLYIGSFGPQWASWIRSRVKTPFSAAAPARWKESRRHRYSALRRGERRASAGGDDSQVVSEVWEL